MPSRNRSALFGLAGLVALVAGGCGGGDGGTGPAPYPEPTPLVLDTTGLLPLPATPDNPLTVQGVELGRKLFYDPILSGDDTQSCASCHAQAFSFTDHGLQFSVGIDGSVGDRNAPAVINLAWAKELFWAGRADGLEGQALQPVPNPKEMAIPWDQAVAKLAAHPDYPAMFGRAFGDENITKERVVMAIAQFERTILSRDSRWDRKQRGEITFTPEETRGEQLFFSERGDCFHCHGSALFTGNQYHDNGLDVAPADPGRMAVTGAEADRGKFRAPTLRNIELTAPYMHDGRFDTLEEVVEHYSSGIQQSPNLSPFFRVVRPGPTQTYSAQEKADLVAFLKALTDPVFIANPDYGPPPSP